MDAHQNATSKSSIRTTHHECTTCKSMMHLARNKVVCENLTERLGAGTYDMGITCRMIQLRSEGDGITWFRQSDSRSRLPVGSVAAPDLLT